MNRTVGWILAALAVAAGWQLYGWQGIVMAASVVVFWLLLQFGRTMRVMQNAGRSPVGMVPSAVMLNARLKPGMTMLEVLQHSRSLGRQVPGTDTWTWTDEGGSTVTLDMPAGRLQSWRLTRPEPAPSSEELGAAPPSP